MPDSPPRVALPAERGARQALVVAALVSLRVALAWRVVHSAVVVEALVSLVVSARQPVAQARPASLSLSGCSELACYNAKVSRKQVLVHDSQRHIRAGLVYPIELQSRLVIADALHVDDL